MINPYALFLVLLILGLVLHPTPGNPTTRGLGRVPNVHLTTFADQAQSKQGHIIYVNNCCCSSTSSDSMAGARSSALMEGGWVEGVCMYRSRHHNHR